MIRPLSALLLAARGSARFSGGAADRRRALHLAGLQLLSAGRQISRPLVERPELLALAFHVEYWNYIGWVDPYSKPWATRRQREYEAALKLRYIYTPEMVVQGASEGIGSEPAVIETLIRTATANRPPIPTWRCIGARMAPWLPILAPVDRRSLSPPTSGSSATTRCIRCR